MSLPWEAKKKVAMLLVKRLGKPSVATAPEVDATPPADAPDEIEMVAEDLLAAVESKSVVDLTRALRAFADLVADEDQVQDQSEAEPT